MILVDQIRQDLAEGRHPWEAIRESAVRRFRPIMLTAAAAVLAMIPLTRSELWGPMAMAIMGGPGGRHRPHGAVRARALRGVDPGAAPRGG